MACQIEQIGDCGDISSLARALFKTDRDDNYWLTHCEVSLSPCGNLLAVGHKNRLCILTSQWIASNDSISYLISWSGNVAADISTILTLSICPSKYTSQKGPDWFCIVTGFINGNVGFYTQTGHLLLLEKLDDHPVSRISCHTGTFGTLPDDIYVLYQTCECIISGESLFQLLRNNKAQLAKIQAGLQDNYVNDSRSLNIKKWTFSDPETVNDAAMVGLELKNSFDHLLAASTFGGYDTWYRSLPPMNSLILTTGSKPYVAFQYALEGGTAPPLQDVAKAVANKIKSALPGWLGGGTDSNSSTAEPRMRSEPLSLRYSLQDSQRQGGSITVSPDRRLAAVTDTLGRVAVLDVYKGYLVRLFKGCRDAQCSFVQIFEQDKKKQLSTIKEIRRATFLIIYNPKKGLIDIRLMQRGNRVAVFTATKNGKLLYNTCGLVGAEKSYTHKRLNLPEFQSVLLDPDGKIKKFSIPFYYALEGEHSERSKDLTVLSELRDYIKRTENNCADFEQEIIRRVAEIKTVELQKHSLEMLIRNYEVTPKIVMSCLAIIWESISNSKPNENDDSCVTYFENLCFLSLFFRNIKGDNVDDMKDIVNKMKQSQSSQCDNTNELDDVKVEFNLLEDDSCILERLLILANENKYNEHHARVTFSDSNTSSYKEFLSCFMFEKKINYIQLNPELFSDKLNNLANFIFNAIFELNDIKNIAIFVDESGIDPKDIIKLVATHVMNMSLNKITIELIERVIEIIYYLCSKTEDAVSIVYNQESLWWKDIREWLVDMKCPLRSMILAMACKAVVKALEHSTINDEDAWEHVSKENAEWGLLIGKLEDISILSIVLMFKGKYVGKSLPKIHFDNCNVNLKFIYSRGKGSVTELIAKWLCGMGTPSEAILANELIDKENETDLARNEEDTVALFIDNNKSLLDDNPVIFKWLSLLRRQFPLSTSAKYIIANMCWEYAKSWQENMQRIETISTVVDCLTNISDMHLRLGMFSIIWSTYIKHQFEIVCRLVNKVGKLPKDPLCLQDAGFNSADMVKFLDTTNKYLDSFMASLSKSEGLEKQEIHYEKIWDHTMPSLVEIAQDTKNVVRDILNLNYQISCTIYYQSYFNVKCSKPLDTLFDVDYHYIFEALSGNVENRELNMKASDKIIIPRKKFITKLIRAAIDTISCLDNDTDCKIYNNEECTLWIDNISTLAELWNIEEEFLRRQETIGLYHLGFDSLAENMLGLIEEPEHILPPLLAISTQRLKRSLEHSSDQMEWIVTVPPAVYRRMQETPLDQSIPAHSSLSTTMSVLQKSINKINMATSKPSVDLQKTVKLTQLIIESCEVLMRRNL